MSIAVTIIFVILAIIIHEMGHAYFMMKYDVEIEEMGLGFRLPFLPSLRLVYKGIPFYISPFLIGAYVKPTENGNNTIKFLNYHQKLIIFGAGVWVNMIFGGLLISISMMIDYFTLTNINNTIFWMLFSGIIITSILLIIFRNFFMKYLLPILGTILMAVLVKMIFKEPFNEEVVGGPIAIAKMIGGVSLIRDAFWLSGAISLSLGIFNAFPIFPLDGGRIVVEMLKRVFSDSVCNAYANISGFLFLIFFFFVIGGDIFRLF